MIKPDIRESFERAVLDADNYDENGINWDWVSADMHMDLNKVYHWEFIEGSLELLIDEWIDENGVLEDE